MKDQQTGVMEKEILSAENLPGQESNDSNDGKQNDLFRRLTKWFKKFINFFLSFFTIFKNIRVIIFIVILIIISAIYLALVTISKEPQDDGVFVPLPINESSSSAETDPEFVKIEEKVISYNNQLELLETDFKDLQAPVVNLEIEF